LSLNRSEKQAVIDEVTGLAAKAQTLVMAEYRGITVADMTRLRSQARDKGVNLSVLKNTLARRAVAWVERSAPALNRKTANADGVPAA